MREKTPPDSIVYTDEHFSYDALDISKFYHHQINHSEDTFYLFLKECEWRFNYRLVANFEASLKMEQRINHETQNRLSMIVPENLAMNIK